MTFDMIKKKYGWRIYSVLKYALLILFASDIIIIHRIVLGHLGQNPCKSNYILRFNIFQRFKAP